MIPIRDENPSRSFPVITILLIAVNIAVYAYQFFLGPDAQAFVVRFGAIPWEITHFRELPGLPPESVSMIPSVLTLFSSMFLHGGLLHLLGNMLYLWIFGDNVESLVGRFSFLVFYILCGLAAALTYVVFDPNSNVPMIGASGAISGVLGAYMISFPSARIHVLVFLLFFIRIIRVPALIVLGFWFLMQLWNGFGSIGVKNAGGIAWFAHIGGFGFGILSILLIPKKKYKNAAWW